MKAIRILLFTLLFISFLSVKADEYPWEKYGFKFKVVTLSNGKYQEFHDLEDVVEIGSVLYNTQTKQIVGFVEKDTICSGANFEPHIVSRWLSPDPLTEEYTSWSPYNYVLNNPIIFVDPDGRIVKPAPGSSQGFIDNYNAASNMLIAKGVGGSYSQLVNSKEVYYIQESSNSFYNASNNTINWNTSTALEVDGKVVLSPTGVFGHEVEHAKNHDDAVKAWYNGDQDSFYEWQAGLAKGTSENYKKKEEENVITGPEQKIAKALGSIGENETTRDSYIGKTVRVNGINSTSKPQPLKKIEPMKVNLQINNPEPKLELK
nr:RHS repeat-associated core domain-containing protein [uncultured Marinifilum sp.]